MTPHTASHVVVGAGVHGLSTAWHLARELRARGEPADVLVLDKSGIGAGASGIACGVIRNNYFQPAMRELMAHSVGIWESDQDALSYHPVGYLQIGHEAMRADVAQIYREQQAIGYPSTFIDGAAESRSYLRELFPDWRADGVSCVLHEHRGGYANNEAATRGLAARAEAAGVQIRTGVRVTGIDSDARTVHTDDGPISCEHVVVAAGPWSRDLWAMLGLPGTVLRRGPDGTVSQVPMWTYWLVQEGTLKVDPAAFTDAQGRTPPVIHVDSDAPLYDEDGAVVTDQPWGIYYKPDANFGGIQGGSMPRRLDEPAAEVAVDPYGPEQSAYTSGPDFVRLWTAGLAHCHTGFAGTRHLYEEKPSGGIGCFTPDSFPVFDQFGDFAYVIADSNHGFKMIGVGALVAAELLDEPQRLLEPFRFDRYASGDLHPASQSPFPWS
jgi:glycine/D-amino acid oxidase-like deaminating enzyme